MEHFSAELKEALFERFPLLTEEALLSCCAVCGKLATPGQSMWSHYFMSHGHLDVYLARFFFQRLNLVALKCPKVGCQYSTLAQNPFVRKVLTSILGVLVGKDNNNQLEFGCI
jgi:hypothetical protein